MNDGDGPTICVVASTMTDMISYLPRIQNAGETIVGDSFALGFGGKGANQAVMARRLGAVVYAIGCVGTDVFGDATVDNFRREKINVAGMRRSAEPTQGSLPSGSSRMAPTGSSWSRARICC